ncbi:MAG: hypothetical protein JWQ84_1839 [Mucilaginibacter sp.]|nr:hypothetical protein [Mucilaginibacter sp.]
MAWQFIFDAAIIHNFVCKDRNIPVYLPFTVFALTNNITAIAPLPKNYFLSPVRAGCFLTRLP